MTAKMPPRIRSSHINMLIFMVTEWNMWLNDTIRFIPKNSWAIDPFGYSPTMAYLLHRMSFENMLIQRTHYELKKELAWNKYLEIGIHMAAKLGMLMKLLIYLCI